MKRGQLKGFSIRLAICLLVLSGTYFAAQQLIDAKPKTTTPDKQLVDVRSKLNELYLRSNTLAAFEANDPTSSETMGRLVAELRNTNDSLGRQSKTASLLTAEQRETINRITTLQGQALKQYQTSHDVLGQVIAFDPGSDLGNIDPAQRSELLTARATAAQTGLLKASASTVTTAASGLAVGDQDGAPVIVTDVTRTALQAEASCFEQLAAQAQVNASGTSATRQRCLDSYPALRRQAVINVMQSAFSPDYLAKLKNLTTPLLNELRSKSDK